MTVSEVLERLSTITTVKELEDLRTVVVNTIKTTGTEEGFFTLQRAFVEAAHRIHYNPWKYENREALCLPVLFCPVSTL